MESSNWLGQPSKDDGNGALSVVLFAAMMLGLMA